MNIPKAKIFKIVVIGAKGVGKTTICRKWEEGKEFDSSFIESSSNSISFFTKSVVVRGKSIDLQVWDCCSDTGNTEKNEIIFDKASLAIVVYDITELESFIQCQHYIEHCRKCYPGIIILLMGNKRDLPNRNVEYSQAQELVKTSSLSLPVEVSALNSKDINTVFLAIADSTLVK